MKSPDTLREREVEALVEMYTRRELDKMARALGLEPSRFRNKREAAKAILDALPSEDSRNGGCLLGYGQN